LRENGQEAVERYGLKYARAIEEMSETWLRGLLDTLAANDILEKTLIMFLGDHGESWGERYDDFSTVQTNFHLHGKLLYDELIRVPLVMRYPEEIPAGTVVDEQVRQVDIFPTVMEMADLEATGEWSRDGRSLVPVLGGEVDPRIAVSSATDVEMSRIEKMSIRAPPEKLIWTLSNDTLELYDLVDDPGETENLADVRGDRAAELKDELAAELERTPTGARLERSVRDQLEDLGYL
jgi:arylsulfatase A-like enzyme